MLTQKHREFKTVTHHKINEIKMFSVYVEKQPDNIAASFIVHFAERL